jgi:GT2 family glycosyltransferase
MASSLQDTAVTVVIPTHRRPDAVLRCLASVLRAATGSTAQLAQVLVVDNGTDVPLAVHPDPSGPPVHVLHEPAPGVARARNRGLGAADSDVVAFLDDDTVVDPRWLDALSAAFTDPAVHAAVGPIRLACEGRRPRWLTDALAPWWSALDLGDVDRRLEHESGWGANLAVRRTAALAVGGFDESLGYGSGSPTLAEDEDLLDRLRHAGNHVAYVADAVVQHQVGHERLQLRWLAARTFRQGTSDATVVERTAPRPAHRRFTAAGRALAHAPRAAPGLAVRTWRSPEARPGLLAEQVALWSQAAGTAWALVR